MKSLKKNWLELTTLAIALIALFLSWQANMIGRSQITPKIVLIDTKLIEKLPSGIINNEMINKDDGGICFLSLEVEEGKRPRMICTSSPICLHQFRIANLGGASTSIVDFEATISFLNQQILLRGEGNSSATNIEENNNLSGSAIYLIPNKTKIFSPFVDNPNSDIFSTDLLQLPARIDEYSAVDMYAQAEILSSTHLSILPYSDQDSSPYSSVNISYSFLFSSGEKLAIPDIPCLYVAQ